MNHLCLFFFMEYYISGLETMGIKSYAPLIYNKPDVETEQ